MTLEIKIERVRELLAQRDEIGRELGEILGGNLAAPPAPRRETPKPEKKATPTKASGRPVAHTRGTPKPCYGSTGARHFKTCKLNGKPSTNNADATSSVGKDLTQEQYDELRDAMHDREFMSAKYALTHELSPREVNAAIRSTDYEDYLESR